MIRVFSHIVMRALIFNEVVELHGLDKISVQATDFALRLRPRAHGDAARAFAICAAQPT